MESLPKCESCHKELVSAISCFKAFQPNPVSEWKLVGYCMAPYEDYTIELGQIHNDEQVTFWLNHLSEKNWFHPSSKGSFLSALSRLQRERAAA